MITRAAWLWHDGDNDMLHTRVYSQLLRDILYRRLCVCVLSPWSTSSGNSTPSIIGLSLNFSELGPGATVISLVKEGCRIRVVYVGTLNWSLGGAHTLA